MWTIKAEEIQSNPLIWLLFASLISSRVIVSQSSSQSLGIFLSKCRYQHKINQLFIKNKNTKCISVKRENNPGLIDLFNVFHFSLEKHEVNTSLQMDQLRHKTAGKI